MGELRARDHKRHPQPTSRDSKLEIKMIFQLDSVYTTPSWRSLYEHLLEHAGMFSQTRSKFSLFRQTLPSSTSSVHKHFRTSNCTNSPARMCGSGWECNHRLSVLAKFPECFHLLNEATNTFHSCNSSGYTFRFKNPLIWTENHYRVSSSTWFLLLTANMLIQVQKEIHYLTWLRLKGFGK